MSDPVIAFVVAVAENGVIGRSGDMPWHMPGDLRRFRQMTMGRPVIMGRKTFEAIGRPLDGRANIVVTRNQNWHADGVERVDTTQEALDAGRRAAVSGGVDEIMVIGGAEIYAAMLPLADRIYLTRIHARPSGDTYFPDPDPDDWREVGREPLERHERDDYASTLITFERIRN